MIDPLTVDLTSLIDPVAELLATVRSAEEHAAAELDAVAPAHLASARNLIHYLALRRHDLRDLQDRLAAVSLSSLGRSECCVEATLQGLLALLARATRRKSPAADAPAATTLESSRHRLADVTSALFGLPRAERRTRIVVTLPSEAGEDLGLVRELVRRGMDAARINCAHDGAATWKRMVGHVRQAGAELGISCRVIMDLAGPKLRTGASGPGPRVVKVRPRRDRRGVVLAPARIWLGAGESPHEAPSQTTTIPVDRAWVAALRKGDQVRLVDARGAHRELRVVHRDDSGALVEAAKTIYFETGLTLKHERGETAIGMLPAVEEPMRVQAGDTLIVAQEGAVVAGPHVTCTLPQVFADVRVGQAIWFDDGAIGGRIASVAADRMTVEITDAALAGAKLGGDKGINLPDTTLRLPALSAKDERDLEFIAAHADLVGYSFVRHPSDVTALQDRLTALGRRDLGIMLKIETREAFENLPFLLLAAMRLPAVSVMIARGDLAVECGWERLAELQEEILWICEAAQVPVVWATQVLEQLAQEGRPSRAEITDAAMGQRAECVMLNKGPHILEAVDVLGEVLQRMEGHQAKKRSMLRPLALAERFGRRLEG